MSAVDDPPEVICLNELEKKVKYLAEQYKITPGGRGPVGVYINAEDISRKWINILIESY